MSSRPRPPVTVLVVDDSPFMRLTIQRILGQDPGIKVLDTARDGLEGIEKLQALKPQVLTMDVEMPVMDGLRALEEIMRWQPTAVIILSAVTTEGAEATIKAFDLGAFDVVAKPAGGPGGDLAALRRDLVDKVKAAAGVDPARLAKHRAGSAAVSHPALRSALPGDHASAVPLATASRPVGQNSGHPGHSSGRLPAGGNASQRPAGSQAYPRHPVEIVAIGTSTGGPAALQAVLPQLPVNFPVPVLVAQHMPPGFTGPLAQRLNGLCALTVREAVHGETLRPGTIYIAPAGKQLRVQRKAEQLVVDIGDEAPIATLYRPSVDVMFLSLAQEVGRGTLGVIMTGMGSDGVRGAKELKALEAFAIAEAEETCVVYGMPRALVEARLADRVVPLPEIGRTIVECVMRG